MPFVVRIVYSGLEPTFFGFEGLAIEEVEKRLLGTRGGRLTWSRRGYSMLSRSKISKLKNGKWEHSGVDPRVQDSELDSVTMKIEKAKDVTPGEMRICLRSNPSLALKQPGRQQY